VKREDKSLREIVIELTKETGIVPCTKLREQVDYLVFAKATSWLFQQVNNFIKLINERKKNLPLLP